MIVSTTGIQTLGLAESFSVMFAFGFEFPNSLADFQSAKESTGFQPVVVELLIKNCGAFLTPMILKVILYRE